MSYEYLNTPIPPPAESSLDPKDSSTFPRFPASQGPDLAAPGPHPHEAADADRLSGEAFLHGNDPTAFIDPAPVPPPAGITAALPGPHPHEAADVRQNGGLVAGWQDPMDGFDDGDDGH